MAEYLMYTGAALDRAAALRRDEGWVADRLDDGATQIVPVWRGRNLIAGGDCPRAVTITGSPARALVRIAESVALLGMDGEVAYFAADVSAHDEEALAPLQDGAEFIDLRQAGALMERRQGMLLAYARGIVYWHHRHRFCGDCGSPTEARQGGHMRVCTGPACGRQHFPR
ncbi:MAG: NADH pyrophosphatase, partial [Proteobacteria bacterium]|nr:NADH pyrophosphatase [Pseudomonadota bacterium]